MLLSQLPQIVSVSVMIAKLFVGLVGALVVLRTIVQIFLLGPCKSIPWGYWLSEGLDRELDKWVKREYAFI